MNRSQRVVIIGGVAAGTKTAAKLRRLDPSADITIVDKGHFVSYAGCGLPYYVSGVIKEQKDLMATVLGVVRDPAFFQKTMNVKVLTRTEATKIDRAARRVEVRDAQGVRWLDYDVLVIATGVRPVVPKLPGIDLPGVFTLHRIEDAEGIKAAAAVGKSAAIIGGGLIGVEMAEALVQLGLRVSVVEMLPQILPMLDWEMATLVQRHMESKGVRVLTEAPAERIEGRERVEAVVARGERILADLAVVAVGIRPNGELAREAGLDIGPTGAIRVDDHMRASDPAIYAVGDCTEDRHLVTGAPVFLSNGASANKKGRVAAINIAGGDDRFPGIVGSTICKVFDFTVARTGLTEKQAREAGFDPMSAIAPAPDKAHFYPGAKQLILKLVADRRTRKLLGAQGVGPGDAARRTDVAATALVAGMTVDQVAQLDLCYAPPYAPPLDNLIVAANVLRNKLDGHLVGISPIEVKAKRDAGQEFVLLDVRTPPEFEKSRIEGAKLIPLGALKDRLAELPRDQEIVTFCQVSLRGYQAQLLLRRSGFVNVKVMDGGIVAWPYEKAGTERG